MGFDSKSEFAPPTIFLGLLLCPWMWGISPQLFQCLLSYWGFSDPGCGISPHSQSSEAQLSLLTSISPEAEDSGPWERCRRSKLKGAALGAAHVVPPSPGPLLTPVNPRVGAGTSESQLMKEPVLPVVAVAPFPTKEGQPEGCRLKVGSTRHSANLFSRVHPIR